MKERKYRVAKKTSSLKLAIKQMFGARIENPMTNNFICFVVTLGYTKLYCDTVLSREAGLSLRDIQPYIDAFLPTIITFVACVVFQNISMKDEKSSFSLTGWTIAAIIIYSGYTLLKGTVSSLLNLVMLCLGALSVVVLAFSSIFQLTNSNMDVPSERGIGAAKPDSGKRKRKVVAKK